MTRVICYGAAGVLTILGALAVLEGVREARLISRLNHDERESTNLDASDRDGVSKVIEQATVRYMVNGTEYRARHRLPEPARRHKVGDRLGVLILPDDPGRSYAAHSVTGTSIMSVILPVLLFVGGALFAAVGWLVGRTVTGGAPAAPEMPGEQQ